MSASSDPNSTTIASSSGSAAGSLATSKIPLSRQRVLAVVDSSGAERRLMQDASASVSTNRTIPLINYNSVIYFADILIETSTFTVLVDTGSSDLWVSCAYVSGSTCSSTCPSKSTVIMYGSGNVCIQGAYAKVQIGNVAVSNYVVGVAQGRNVLPTSSTNLLPGSAQGLLGLGYQSIAAIPTPGGQFIDYLTSFSIYLTDDAFSSGSFMLLNGVDSALVAKNQLKPYTIPLIERAHWSIGMTAFQVGSDAAVYPCSTTSTSTSRASSASGCRSIVDTGTSLLSMPTSLFSAFAATYLVPLGCFVPSSTATESGNAATSTIYVCPKSASLPRLAFTFGNVTLYLDGSDYLLPVAQSNYAIVELQATASAGSLANSWIIGDTFLKKYYSAYTTNQSVTFYCPPGDCVEGAVSVGGFPASGQASGGGGGGSGVDGASASGGSSGGVSSTTVIVIVAAAVLGLVLIAVGVVVLRRWRRQRRSAADADALQSPAAPNGAFYAANQPLSPIGPRV